jgi:hypothetical protein
MNFQIPGQLTSAALILLLIPIVITLISIVIHSLYLHGKFQ